MYMLVKQNKEEIRWEASAGKEAYIIVCEEIKFISWESRICTNDKHVS